MTKIGLLVRFIFFCLFFAIGASAMSLSILAPEILENYRNIDELKRNQQINKRLSELVEIYAAQIEIIENDPEVAQRLEEKTFGSTEPKNTDGAFPTPTQEFIEMANTVLEETQAPKASMSKYRKYIEQSARPKNRKGLFWSGAALIMIAFIFFGAPSRKALEEN